MRKRTLGRSGLGVSTIGYRCMNLNWPYGPGAEKQTAARALAAAPMIPLVQTDRT